MSIDGRTIIVTGGGRGIGRTICVQAAKRGARVVVADANIDGARATCELLRAESAPCAAVQVDVSSRDQTERMAEEAKNAFGRIDALVNNAAYYYGLRKTAFDSVDPDEWDRVMSVNVKGAWLCSRAVFRYMRAAGGGKIVNISSGTAFTGTVGFPHYVASKAAVLGLTRALSRELGEYGICVNAVAPGYTETSASLSINGPELSETMARTRAIKRSEWPEDIAGAVLFLCSGDSDFITGQTIVVDGGIIMH